jgi:hypothetical protein
MLNVGAGRWRKKESERERMDCFVELKMLLAETHLVVKCNEQTMTKQQNW